MNFPNNAKEQSKESSRIDDGLSIPSSPGGHSLAAGPNIQHARGPHRPLRGPSCNLTWYSNAERGGTSHLIKAKRRFPRCICEQELRLSPETQETTQLRRRKSHRKITVMKQWRMANKKYWPCYFQEPKIFVCLFVCFLFVFVCHLNICHSAAPQRQLVARIFFQWKGIFTLF